MANKKKVETESVEVQTEVLDISAKLNAAQELMSKLDEASKAKKEEQAKQRKQASAEAKKRDAETQKQRQDAERQAKVVAERKLAEFSYAENYRKKLIKDNEKHISASKQKELDKKAAAAARELEERNRMIAEMLEAERLEAQERAARADAALERAARVAMDMAERMNAAKQDAPAYTPAPASETAPATVSAPAVQPEPIKEAPAIKTAQVETADDGIISISMDDLGKTDDNGMTLNIPATKITVDKSKSAEPAPAPATEPPVVPYSQMPTQNPFANAPLNNPYANVPMQNPYAAAASTPSAPAAVKAEPKASNAIAKEETPSPVTEAPVAESETPAAEGSAAEAEKSPATEPEVTAESEELVQDTAAAAVIPVAVIKASRKEEKKLAKAQKKAEKAEKKAERAAKLAEREEMQAEELALLAKEQEEKKNAKAAKKTKKLAEKQAKVAEAAEREAREAEAELQKYNVIVEKAAAKRDKKRAAKQAKLDKKNKAKAPAEITEESTPAAVSETDAVQEAATVHTEGISAEPVTVENMDKAYDMAVIENDIKYVNLPSLPKHIKMHRKLIKKLEKQAARVEKKLARAKEESAKVERAIELLAIYKQIIDTLCEDLKCCSIMGVTKYNKEISKKIKKTIAKYNATVNAYESVTGDEGRISRLDTAIIASVMAGGAYVPVTAVSCEKVEATPDNERDSEVKVARKITESEKSLIKRANKAAKKKKAARSDDTAKLAALADEIMAKRDLTELLSYEMRSAVSKNKKKDTEKYKKKLTAAIEAYNAAVGEYEELTGAALAKAECDLADRIAAGEGYEPLPELSYAKASKTREGKLTRKERKAHLRAVKRAQAMPESLKQLNPYISTNDKQIAKLQTQIKKNERYLKRQESAVDYNRTLLNIIMLKGNMTSLIKDNLVASYRLSAERQTKLYKTKLFAAVESYNISVNAYYATTGAWLVKIAPTLADDIVSGRSYQAIPTLEWRERFIELKDRSQALGDESLVFVFPKVADIADGQSTAAETYVYNVDLTTTPLITDRIVESPVNISKYFAKLKIRNKRGISRYEKAVKKAEPLIRRELFNTEKQIAKAEGFARTKFMVKRLVLIRQLIDIATGGLEYSVRFSHKKKTVKYKNTCLAEMINYNSYVEQYIKETEQLLTPASAFIPYDIIEGRDFEPMPVLAYRKEFVERNGDDVRVVDAIGKNGALAAMEAHRAASEAGTIAAASKKGRKNRESKSSSDTDESAGRISFVEQANENEIEEIAEAPKSAKAKRAAKAADKAERKARLAEERALERLALAEAKKDSKRAAKLAKKASERAEIADDRAAIKEERAELAVQKELKLSAPADTYSYGDDGIIPTRPILDDVRTNNGSYDFIERPYTSLKRAEFYEEYASQAARQAENNAQMAEYYANVADSYQIDASYSAEVAAYSANVSNAAQTRAENLSNMAEYSAAMARYAAEKSEYSAAEAQYHEDSANIGAIKADNALSMANYYAGKALGAQAKAAYAAKQAENYAHNTELYADYIAEITSKAEESQRLADITMLNAQDVMNRPHAITVATATSAAVSGAVNKILDLKGLQVYASANERVANRHYRHYASLYSKLRRLRGNDKIVCLLDALTQCKARFDIYSDLLMQAKRSMDKNPFKSREIGKHRDSFKRKLTSAIKDYNELVEKYTEISANRIPPINANIPKLILEGKKYDPVPDITYSREFAKPGGENLVLLKPGLVVETVVDNDVFASRSALVDKIHAQIDLDMDAVSKRYIYAVNLKERSQNVKNQYQFGLDTRAIKAGRKATAIAVERLKAEHKRALALEREDNERYYKVVENNPMLMKVKDENSRNRLALIREEIILLLDRRNEINAKLVAMYTGTDVDRNGEPVNPKYEKVRFKAAKRAYRERMRRYGEIRKWKIEDKYKQRVFDLMNREVQTIADLEQLKVRITKEKLTRKQRVLIRKDIRSKQSYLKLLKNTRKGAFKKALHMYDDKKFGAEIGLWIAFLILALLVGMAVVFWQPLYGILQNLLGK